LSRENSDTSAKTAVASLCRHGKTEKEIMTAVWLYCHGLSLRAIARFFKVTASAVLKWVRNYARNNHEKPAPKSDAVVVERDEMWRFLFSKKTKSGFGKLIVAIPIHSLTGNVEGGILICLPNSTTD
jgi:hypothetical protein